MIDGKVDFLDEPTGRTMCALPYVLGWSCTWFDVDIKRNCPEAGLSSNIEVIAGTVLQILTAISVVC